VQMTVKVYEGERLLAKDNRLLKQLEINNIPAEPRGVPRIKVTLEIDVNGAVNVEVDVVVFLRLTHSAVILRDDVSVLCLCTRLSICNILFTFDSGAI
jgi:molecular chaperone DnaK (HSP70)